MPDNVACKDCGWLSVRIKDTRELVDADHAYRDSGFVPSRQIGRVEPIFDSLPICFANVRQYYAELRSPTPGDAAVRGSIHKAIDCDKFVEWLPGTTPKELQQLLMLTQQQEWQANRDADDRKWRESQEAVAESRHQDNLRIVAEATRWSWWGTLISACVGVLAALGSVLVTKLIGAY